MGRAGTFGAAIAASSLLLAGCGGGAGSLKGERLTGSNIDIAATIPDGWHRVVDSSNPSVPEMVFPSTCVGSQAVTCATGLARLATFAAPTAAVAAQSVQRAVTASPGVRLGETTSQGPGKVGDRAGYRLRFAFSNSVAKLVSEVAVVPTGSSTPDAQGNHEFSVLVVWVSDAIGAPNRDVIDQIVGSAVVVDHR